MNERAGFYHFVVSKTNRRYLIITAFMAVIYFACLRYLFPVPSFYSDSFTWIGGANTRQPVSMRPIGYSKLLIFFKLFSTSDFALIAGQYVANVVANLFLFFTFLYFFPLGRFLKVALYLLLIANPFYLLYSNYISSDAFFNCLAVVWFTLLIWVMHKPSWLLIICQLIVLVFLFELRYNAIYFPAISALAFFLAPQTLAKKCITTAINILAIVLIITYTTYATKKYTGTSTFSAFSGWQMANDGLHVMRYTTIDTTTIKDKEVKALLHFVVNYFDTTRQSFPDTAATAFYMWHINSPLKKYMNLYPKRQQNYFATWNALGPLYSKFGETIILQQPFIYARHFILPNTKAYFLPQLEIYDTYMENHDTIAAVAQKFFHYKNKKTPPHHPALYAAVFLPAKYLFTAVNILFIVAGLYYFFSKKYKLQKDLFNQTFLCFCAVYCINFCFIVLLAPTVVRYHVFIFTLSFPVLLYLLQQIAAGSFVKPEKNE